ncbi:MAG: cupin domain-containing protein [Methylocystis sp.]|nr:cupin domain-containing protein [Methylocystis sp.]
MSDADDDTDAALFAAGALTKAEIDAFKLRLKRDCALAAKAREWEEALAPLGALAGETEPPPALLDSIESRLDARTKLEKMSRTLRADEGDWITLAPGVRCKELLRNDAIGRWTILVDAQPGAFFPPHEHAQDEEIYMISGDLSIGDVTLEAGDFHFSPAGSRHPENRTRAGCRCIIAQAM